MAPQATIRRMTTHNRDILVTMALPYANGMIHLGHMIEAIQTDIWVRFQKQCGHRAVFVSGSDAHGTAIMIAAENAGVSPEQLVADVRKEHMADFAQFHIDFDTFYTTHSSENEQLSADIYTKLNARGDISTRDVTQAFDPEKQLFLADRFIKGDCPKCHAPDQYGDNCEVCGATYVPTDLKNPYSTLTGATPIEKTSRHYFFHLENYAAMLTDWMTAGHLQPQVANKLKEWFADGLKPWDISRDAPYFGFEIPDAPGKYFYVWLDAPVGYMAAVKALAEKQPDIHFDHYWTADSNTELYHFIGKDIMYFHALFWPAMLQGAGYRLPTKICVHGYLTINGEKMSKSRGTFITAKTYLKHLHPEYLRYYFAAKLGNGVEDIDLNLQDFMSRVNADLVGKFVNLASRTAGFITKKFDGQLSSTLHAPALFRELVDAGEAIAKDYETLNNSHAVRRIMALADRANQYIDQHKPWALAKIPEEADTVQAVCTQGLNCFKVIATYLKPILPETATKIEAFLNTAPLTFENRELPLLDHRINAFKPLMQRITTDQLTALTNEPN